MRLGFCISGKGRLALLALRQRQALGFEVGSILLGPSASRELEIELSDLGIQPHRLSKDRDIRDTELIEQMTNIEICDYWMLTFDHLIPDLATSVLQNRIINLHVSLLPAFQGLRALPRSIESGSLVIGATCHFVDSTVDRGPIISQFVMPASPYSSFEHVEAEFARRVSGLYLQCLRWIVEERVCFTADGSKVVVSGGEYSQLPHVPALEHVVLQIIRDISAH